jgi:hypothetical protein
MCVRARARARAGRRGGGGGGESRQGKRERRAGQRGRRRVPACNRDRARVPLVMTLLQHKHAHTRNTHTRLTTHACTHVCTHEHNTRRTHDAHEYPPAQQPARAAHQHAHEAHTHTHTQPPRPQPARAAHTYTHTRPRSTHTRHPPSHLERIAQPAEAGEEQNEPLEAPKAAAALDRIVDLGWVEGRTARLLIRGRAPLDERRARRAARLPGIRSIRRRGLLQRRYVRRSRATTHMPAARAAPVRSALVVQAPARPWAHRVGAGLDPRIRSHLAAAFDVGRPESASGRPAGPRLARRAESSPPSASTATVRCCERGPFTI